jgi:hypothetical protein
VIRYHVYNRIMKTTTNKNLKYWSTAALLSLILGYARHGARDTREMREMVEAKDELKRRGMTWGEIKAEMERAAA